MLARLVNYPVQPTRTCYTKNMKKPAQTTQKKKTVTAAKPAGGQLWRDRLNKTKPDTNRTGPAGATGDTDLRTRFQKTASGSTARKSRKGMRPG